jgi:hypothetical protein
MKASGIQKQSGSGAKTQLSGSYDVAAEAATHKDDL